MNDQEFLQHYGVLGMKWGRRRAPTSEGLSKRKAQYEKKIEKMGKRNSKMETRIVKTESKAAGYKQRAAATQTKFNKQMVKNMTEGPAKKNIKRAKRLAKRLSRDTKYDAQLTKKAARYKKKIYKNKKLAAKLNTKIKDIDQQKLALGKANVDVILKKSA